MGIEPASTPGDAGQGANAERRREVHTRTGGAVAQLDQGESISVGNQLGKCAGGCFPQLVVDMGRPVAGGSWRGREISHGAASSARVSRALHRALSIYLLFSEHAPAGRSSRAFLSGDFVSANAWVGALEEIRSRVGRGCG